MADAPDTALRGLLRQLAIGLSVFRLYAGDVGVPAVRAAVGRIDTAAGLALAGGPVTVDLRAGRFVGPDGAALDDDGLVRLAAACFERRVEHLEVTAPPRAAELAVLFAALSDPPEEVAAAGGVHARLSSAGVTSLRTREDVPVPVGGQALPDEQLVVASWSQATADTPTEVPLELDLRPGEDAASLYLRLRVLAAGLPEDVAARSPFYRRAAELVAELPYAEQPVFARLALDEAATVPFAERFLGQLTDLRLAELLVRVAEHEGIHPAVLARGFTAAGGRHPTLHRLALDLLSVPADDPTAVTDPAPLVAAFPADEAAGRELALLACADVLRNAPRPEHLTAIAAAVTAELRAALIAGRTGAVEDLLAVVAAAADADPGGPLRSVLVDTLDGEVVLALLAASAEAVPSRHLRPFGAHAIGPLLAALGLADDDQRPRVSAMLVRLLPDHLDVVKAEIPRQSPTTLIGLAAVLGELGGPRLLPVLSRLALHPDPDVLRATVAAVARQDPVSAPPLLAAIATRTGDHDVQRRCIDALAPLGTPAASDALQRLARRGSSPLPPRMRRRAKAAARRAPTRTSSSRPIGPGPPGTGSTGGRR